ncbi:MAG: hypothetical protein ACREUT_14160 [Steroidobacteraceae bacterium]
MNPIARSFRRLAGSLVIGLFVGSWAHVAHADDASIKADVRNAAHAVGDAAHHVGEDVKRSARKVRPTARKVGRSVAHAAKDAGKAVARGARETGTELKEATHKGVSTAKRGKKDKGSS